MVRNQVSGVGKVRFSTSKTVHCVICKPQTAISMRNAAQHLSSDVWNQYLSAMSEADVVAEQQRFEGILKKQQEMVITPLEKAMTCVRSKMQAHCPKCMTIVSDFSACASLVCGRVEGVSGGPSQSALGCGALLCGWCLRVCSIHDHSSHVADCLYNPRKGNIFPESRASWLGVQNYFARQRVYQFAANLPRDLAGEVLRATAAEFPDVMASSEFNPVAMQQRNDSSDRMLRPNPPPRQPSFLENVDQLMSLNIANRARAEQVLESCGNDLEAAIDLLLAV